MKKNMRKGKQYYIDFLKSSNEPFTYLEGNREDTIEWCPQRPSIRRQPAFKKKAMPKIGSKRVQQKRARQSQQDVSQTGLAPKHGWDGVSRDSEPPNRGVENQIEGLYRNENPFREPGINQGTKRPYVGNGPDSAPENESEEGPHMKKRRQLSNAGWIGNERLPERPGAVNVLVNDQTGESSHCQGQVPYQAPCISQGRKRPYIGGSCDDLVNASGETPDIEKIRRLSANFTYQINGLYKLDSNKPCTEEAEWTGEYGNDSETMFNDRIGMNMQQSQSTTLPNAGESVTHKLAIIRDDYPATLFELEQFDTVQMAILKKLEDTPDPLPVVNMGFINSLGVIPVRCEGKHSANFLFSFSGCILKGGIKIKVVNAADLPKPCKMAWKTRNVICTDLKPVFRMLQRCNPLLRTAHWRVVDTEINPHSVRRIVFLDTVSAEYIKSNNYSIPDGLYRSKFKVLDDPNIFSHVPNNDNALLNKDNFDKDKVQPTMVNNCPVIDIRECEEDKEEFPPPLPDSGGVNIAELDSSLYEVQQPVVTVDLTEDSSYEDDQDFSEEL